MPITQVKSQKLLGVILDQNLTFKEHVESLGKKLSKRISLFKRIKNVLPHESELLHCDHQASINVRKLYLDIVF